MGNLLAVTLMASLWLAQPPAADRPVVSIPPGTQVALRHMVVGNQPIIRVEVAGVTIETAKLRLNLGDNSTDLDAVVGGIRVEGENGVVGIFSERTMIGRKKKG